MAASNSKQNSVIDQVKLKDFRCFRGEQKARLSRLTFLVGENSTGKTSFLALIRSLCDVAYNERVPDFKEDPYDLGSFSEIAHRRGGSASRIDNFEAGIRIADSSASKVVSKSFDVVFEKKGTAPVPAVRKISDDRGLVSVRQVNGAVRIHAQTGDGVSFASAPVRSKPRRTYDPSRPARDPEGDYVPMCLAHLARQSPGAWKSVKKKLEEFGKSSGLFDEIEINSLGKHESQPFQIQVRKRGKRLTGPWRNLVDMGYGVSQVLTLVAEMMRPDVSSVFLLQQPEVHLHPSAQAALGSLFCQVAENRQLIVETHSDYLLNRVRMDIRDQRSPLSADDVSVLYFERREIDVRIHSIRLDAQGNILNAPPGYGQFFIDEASRSGAY